ncbi:amino acid transporter [Oxalobacteraceae bacterium GrIS 2.11]
MSEKSSMSQTTTAEQDAAQLAALGYTATFERSMSLWENFSLGFTYLSPVVGVYSVFALAIMAGGPPMFWTYLLVGAGQLTVCLVFGEVVSQYPISGGLYPWARRLVGVRWAWMAGWIYMWALWTTIAAVSMGGAPFVAQLLGYELSPVTNVVIAVTAVINTTILNLMGTRLLARVAMFGFICEIVGAICVGIYLLFFARLQSVDILFNTYQFGHGLGYVPALLAASVGATFCYYGFEACGDVAEETPNPSRAIPRAMYMTIFIGGAAAMLVCLALLLAIPDLQAAMSGKDADPVTTVLKTALGEVGFRVVIAIVLVSFFSCLLSLQAAASRLLHAYARDGMIVGSGWLKRISGRTHVPSNALLVAGVIPCAIIVLGLFMEQAAKTIIVFGSMGIYVCFQMIVLGALYARKNGWVPQGAFRLGKWALPVNIIAMFFGIGAIINLGWPRSPTDPWYLNYGMVLTLSIVIGMGLIYMLVARPVANSEAATDESGLQKSR